MNLKKWSTGLLGSIMLTGGLLAGCGSDDGSSGDQVEVDVFQFKVEFREEFEQLAETYEEENPDVSINITTVGGGEDYGSALRSRFNSGNEPSIFNVGGPQDVEDWSDYLADLSETESANAALPGTLDGVTVNDGVYGLPYNLEGYGFIYNTRIFEEAGIDVDSIQSFDDLEGVVETLDSQKEELGLDAVFAFPGAEAWVTGLHLSNTFLAPEFNHNVTDAYEADGVEFEYGEAFESIVDLQDEYSVQPTVSLDYSQQVEELFSLQRVAIIQQGNWVYPSITGIDEEFANEDIDMMPIPVEGYEENLLPVGVPMYWAVNENLDEEVVEASKDFLDWLYTSDLGKEAVVNDFNFIPAYDGYDAEDINDPLSQTIYEYSENDQTIGWVFMGYPTGWGEDQLGALIQKYLSEEASWDEIISETQEAWESSRE
ncbi:ABC transporter substrate-binding protein [Alkalibacillus haloalkaliphilus]|uniref:ABC transporter substrate-binding protein n=1 Tax=Alkalibacillus haloalkaliphilus TaxID=94136 RepID=UPI002935BF02|nr:ABC transporter substrate-binding protein [Alkalibacillus haloalkaliphilus]MDV2581514.1 ABC transporter substrate-binding protein [Alkalibacillus haloalkaliphilus]